MSEPQKNRLDIDGGQVADDGENISSYKPILEADTELDLSKSNLTKSKEKVSSDGAEEKLLQKEKEAKITTRVDMADAKYVVGDHRNGDAKIELDANKKFAGLTKEELLLYAEDPFWVRLRWTMFVLFWALWLCMLAGAIAIIVQAPKCAAPPPRTWFEKGPLVDMSDAKTFQEVEDRFMLLQSAKVQGVFVPGSLVDGGDTYRVLEDTNPGVLDQFKTFAKKAKDIGLRVVVDLTANFVSTTHQWFTLSENRTEEYADYFVWAKGNFDSETSKPLPPNNWVSTVDGPAWTKSEVRQEFYLHQQGEGKPDLNFANPKVVKRFDEVLRRWMKAGAAGVRLWKARQLLVNSSFPTESESRVPGPTHSQYAYLNHRHSSDQPQLDELLQHWAHLVDVSADTDSNAGLTVLTMLEEAEGSAGALWPELWQLERRALALRPPSAAPVRLARPAGAVAQTLAARLPAWPALRLLPGGEGGERGEEAAALAMLLPAAPLLHYTQLQDAHNSSLAAEWAARLAALRSEASVEHGNVSVTAVPGVGGSAPLLACLRWKAGHTGYAAVWNPGPETARANLTALPSLPLKLTVMHVSQPVRQLTNYTGNQQVMSDELLVPSLSTVLLTYVPLADN